FLNTQFNQKCDIVDDITSFDARHALAMLQASICARPMYWARICHPARGHAAFQSFDDKVDWGLARVCDTTQASITDSGKLLRGLPLAKGGLGMRRLSPV